MAALARGGSLEEAADAAGIGTTTLYRWLALSRAGDPRFARLAEAVDAVHRGSVNGRMFGALLGKAALRKIW
jgi:DNA-binding phage protein